MNSLPGNVVFSAKEIAAATTRVAALLQQVLDAVPEAEWTLLVVLNGGMPFATDLMRHLRGRLRVETLRVARYRQETGGELRWLARPQASLRGCRVVLVDDIYDEGKTLAAIQAWLDDEGVAEQLSCVLLEKDLDRPAVASRPALVGLTCPDLYVFGYGMDLREMYRNLDHIRAL